MHYNSTMNQASLLCHKMKIPDTLDHLLYCLTKEILCKQPENVYEFAGDFFHQLVEERNGKSHAGSYSSSLKPSSSRKVSSGINFNEENEEIDDFEKELQTLNEDKIEKEENISPPPTFDESMSDRDSSPVTIAAVVTSKTLETPQNLICTSISIPASDVLPETLSNFEEISDLFDPNCHTNSSASNVLHSKPEIPPEPSDDVSDEMNLAAIQIQSAYRGHRARRDMATNQNVRIDTIDSSTDFVEINKFEQEFVRSEVEKTKSEESNEVDKAQGIDVIVEKKEDVDLACTVEQISFNDEMCNSFILEESERMNKGETDNIEDQLETQQINQSKKMSEEDDNDPINSINYSVEKFEQDKVIQTNIFDSNNTNDFLSETKETLSTEAIDNVMLDHRNSEVEIDVQESESLAIPGCDIEEIEAISEINGQEEEDLEIRTDNLSKIFKNNEGIPEKEICNVQVEEGYQQMEHFNIDIPEDEDDLQNMKGYPSEELVENLEEILEDNAPLSEEQDEESVRILDPIEGNMYMQCQENSTDNDIAAFTEEKFEIQKPVIFDTETKECLDSDQSPCENKILSNHTLNEKDGYFNLCSDTRTVSDNHQNPSTNTFINHEEGYKSEEEKNSEIIMSISEEINEEDIASKEEIFVPSQEENGSDLSDHFADFAYNAKHLVDENTIPETNMIAINDREDCHLFEDNKDKTLDVELDNQQDIRDLSETENDFMVEKDNGNEMFEEGDQAASNDDEEEIWNKLQKDIELEEEQQSLAAIKIQSAFRGYQTRKDLNLNSDIKHDIVNNTDIPQTTSNDSVENYSGDNIQDFALESPLDESLKKNDNSDEGLSEALAELTETIASVALFMTDTTQHNTVSQCLEDNTDLKETNQNLFNDYEEDIALAIVNTNEVNDVTEVLMTNGEEINNIQLIDSYVIVSSIADDHNSPTEIESSIIEDDKESTTNSDAEKTDTHTVLNETTIKDTEASDPEVIFELYVESNETTNDGLLESYWQPKEDYALSQPLNYNNIEMKKDLTLKTSIENEQENAAATKIQANYRGYQDRKRLKHSKDKKEPGVMKNDEYLYSTDAGCLFASQEFADVNQLNLTSIELENAAATKIQATYRGHQDRKRTKHLKDQITNSTTVAIEETQMVQVSIPNRSDKLTLQTQPSIELQNAAATKIQATFRGHQDRKFTEHLKDQILNPDICEIKKTHTIENKIESKYLQKPEQNLTWTEEENEAAIKIQAGYRGHQDRKRIKHIKGEIIIIPEVTYNEEITDFGETTGFCSYNKMAESNKNLTELENAAATKIQAGYRGHQDRKRVKHLKHQFSNSNVDIDETQLEKAKQINRPPSDEFIFQNEQNVNFIEIQNAAATKIQAGYRGYQDRKRVQLLKDEIHINYVINDDESQNDNGMIQSDSEEMRNIQFTQPSVIFELENAAAKKIQSGYRSHRDRKRAKHLNDNVTNPSSMNIKTQFDTATDIILYNSDQNKQVQSYLTSSTELEEFAATKIQASYRGYQDRKRVKNLKDQINPIRNVNESTNLAEITNLHEREEFIHNIQSNVTSMELENAAAITIQSAYRGHKDRKHLQLNNSASAFQPQK